MDAEQLPSEPSQQVGLPGLRRRGLWLDAAAIVGLLIATAVVVLAYAIGPQSPADFNDRILLAVDKGLYGPGFRVGDRLQVRASRARLVGRDSLADALEWSAARAFFGAAEAAPGPREEMSANDRMADSYLQLGWSYLAEGRGRRFGLGRRSDALRAAEDIGACVVSVAPTRRRVEINTFVEDLEKALGRPMAGRCPQ